MAHGSQNKRSLDSATTFLSLWLVLLYKTAYREQPNAVSAFALQVPVTAARHHHGAATPFVRSSSSSYAQTVRIPQSQHPELLGLHSLPEAYQFCLTHYQLPTESLTAAACAGLGDVAAQWRSLSSSEQQQQQRGAWDWKRVAIFLAKGGVSGVIWSHWYTWLDPVSHDWAMQWSGTLGGTVGVPFWGDHPTVMAAVVSTFLEQIIFCPILFAVWDLPFPMLCRGDPATNIPTNVRTMLLPVCVENSKVWTVANLIIYSTPLQYRVVLTSCADAVWQMLLAEQLAKEPANVSEPPPAFLVDDTITINPTRSSSVEIYSPAME